MSGGPWFVRFAGRRSGPFDAERLRIMARRGALTRTHSLSEDGRTWQPATAVRAVFAEDGTIAVGPPPCTRPEPAEDHDGFRQELEGMPDADMPESGLPGPGPRRLGGAHVRPVVILALALATAVLAVPTSRDESGALAWWWSEGPLTIAVRGLATLSVALGWFCIFLVPEPARAASIAGVAAMMSVASAASLLPWSPWASLLGPLVPLSAIMVGLDAAGAASTRLAGRFCAAAAGILGVGALAVVILRPSMSGFAAVVPGAIGAGILAWSGVQAGSSSAAPRSVLFWGGVAAAVGAMSALFATAVAALFGDVPMQGAEAAVAACLVLAFATLAWAAVHETVETVHALPRGDGAAPSA